MGHLCTKESKNGVDQQQQHHKYLQFERKRLAKSMARRHAPSNAIREAMEEEPDGPEDLLVTQTSDFRAFPRVTNDDEAVTALAAGFFFVDKGVSAAVSPAAKALDRRRCSNSAAVGAHKINMTLPSENQHKTLDNETDDQRDDQQHDFSLFAATEGGDLVQLAVESGRVMRRWQQYHSKDITKLVFHATSLAPTPAASSLTPASSLSSFSFSSSYFQQRAEGGYLFSASRDALIKMMPVGNSSDAVGTHHDCGDEGDSAAGSEHNVIMFKGHTLNVTCIAPIGSGYTVPPTLLASGSRDNTVRLWDTSTGQQIASQDIKLNVIHCLAWVPALSCVAQGGEDLTIRLWDVRAPAAVGDGRGSGTIYDGDGGLMCSPTMAAAAPGAGTAFVARRGSGIFTNTRQLELRHTIANFEYHPICCELIDDGGMGVTLATGHNGFNNTGAMITLWDLRMHAKLKELTGHQNTVRWLKMSDFYTSRHFSTSLVLEGQCSRGSNIIAADDEGGGSSPSVVRHSRPSSTASSRSSNRHTARKLLLSAADDGRMGVWDPLAPAGEELKGFFEIEEGRMTTLAEIPPLFPKKQHSRAEAGCYRLAGSQRDRPQVVFACRPHSTTGGGGIVATGVFSNQQNQVLSSAAADRIGTQNSTAVLLRKRLWGP